MNVNLKLVLIRLVAAAVLALLLTKAITSRMVHAGSLDLQRYAAKVGTKAPIETFQAINRAASFYHVDPIQMVAIAILESKLNHKSLNVNKNGTRDVGLFQINTVIIDNECAEYNVFNLQGNAFCAAKLIHGHEEHAKTDPEWLGRFHSKSPSQKTWYVNQLTILEERAVK